MLLLGQALDTLTFVTSCCVLAEANIELASIAVVDSILIIVFIWLTVFILTTIFTLSVKLL